MKITSACHNHTNFCDAKATPAQMAAAAYAKGFTDFGFSGHTRTRYQFEENYGVQDEMAYVQALRALQKEYQGKMNIAVGMEQDYYAPIQNRATLDFILGAVHDFYDANTGKFYWIDADVATLQKGCEAMFQNDGIAMAKAFYALTAENALQHRPEVIAHFDLIVKNNQDQHFFSEESDAYRNAALEALHACMQTDAIFEVNTGGVYRGYRNTPYPDCFLLRELCACGAHVMLSADAHVPQSIDFQFEKTLSLLKSVGFQTITVLENGAFEEKALR